MELLVLPLLALVAAGAAIARHHRQVVQWDEELAVAFGSGESREIAAHRSL